MIEKRKRGRPRGVLVTNSSTVLEPEPSSEPLTPGDLACLQFTSEIPKVLERLKKSLKEPTVHKRFRGNVFLLMGRHELAIYRLASLAGCSQSTLSRLLDQKCSHLRFEKTGPFVFIAIATSLKVSVHTLLFVDLRERFDAFIAALEASDLKK